VWFHGHKDVAGVGDVVLAEISSFGTSFLAKAAQKSPFSINVTLANGANCDHFLKLPPQG
jgi:hypothetical protein